MILLFVPFFGWSVIYWDTQGKQAEMAFMDFSIDNLTLPNKIYITARQSFRANNLPLWS